VKKVKMDKIIRNKKIVNETYGMISLKPMFILKAEKEKTTIKMS
jgi:hypothetical protein